MRFVQNRGVGWFFVVLVVVVLLGGVESAAAQGVGPEIPIWSDTISSLSPQVAYNSTNEEFLVVWHNNQSGGSRDIYARRVLIDGTLSTWFAIFAIPGEVHWLPSVAYNSAQNEYLVAWYELVGSWQDDVFAARVAWDGSTVGSPINIGSPVDVQMWPTVAANPIRDEYLVSYSNIWAGGTYDVDGQRVDGDGTLLSWANIESGSDPRHYSSVAHQAATDTYLIVYNLHDLPGTDWTVHGKLASHDLSGVSVAPEIEICSAAHSGMPVVAAGDGGFLVVWYDGASSEPRARRIAQDGTPLGSGTGFSLAETSGAYWTWPSRLQSVTYAPPIGYVAVWSESPTASTGDLRARLVSPASDQPLGSQIDIETGSDVTDEPSVACAPWGTCLVAYQNEGDIAARLVRFDVFADGFDETGDPSRWSTVAP